LTDFSNKKAVGGETLGRNLHKKISKALTKGQFGIHRYITTKRMGIKKFGEVKGVRMTCEDDVEEG